MVCGTVTRSGQALKARDQAFAQPPVDAEASEQMRAAIAERFPEVVLDAVADYLMFPDGIK